VAFRSFGRLHARVLLAKQDTIIDLEQRLDTIDELEANAYYLSSKRTDGNSERLQLLVDIEKRLVEYGTIFFTRVTTNFN